VRLEVVRDLIASSVRRISDSPQDILLLMCGIGLGMVIALSVLSGLGMLAKIGV
jgi:ribose 5-phosphate isomerase RpiB